MSAKQLEAQMLKDAEEAGFKVFNGTIHLPAACEVMDAFQAFAIIRENRAIEPLVKKNAELKSEILSLYSLAVKDMQRQSEIKREKNFDW